jgi:hypothetical protein
VTESAKSRIAFLEERVEAASARNPTTFPVPFRQHQIDVVKIEAPIGFPLYRLESGRTHRAQSLHVERNGLPANFFDDPESDATQAAQHEILLDLINQQNLAQDLIEKQQRNPVVLTYDGFIVDGNRRTCALRDQGDVENVTAVVLPPDATASEVYETELELQMARQTKADYNWIDEALHVNYGVTELYGHRSGQEAIHAIAQRMNRDDKDIEEILGRLTMVDLYLEWLGQPGKYHRIAADGGSESRQAFVELYERQTRQQFRTLPELQRRAIRQACFTVIHQEGGYMDIRRVADAIRTRPAEVATRVKDELPDELGERIDQPLAQPNDAAGDGGVLDELAAAEDEGGTPDGVGLLNVVEAPDDAEEVAPALMSVAEEIDEEQREAKQHLEPVKKVERALKLLQDVRLTDETRRLDEVAEALDHIVREADRLGEELDGVRSEE